MVDHATERDVALSATSGQWADNLHNAMLDERKTAILRAVVQEYITTAQPVGSTHIANAPGVQVSSATVRHDMAALNTTAFWFSHIPLRGESPPIRDIGSLLII